MSKVYLFAVMLLAASLTGCIEGGDLEKSTTTDEEVEETEKEEEETLDPVGADDNAGQPGVEFVGLFDNYYLIVAIYDPDGYILSYDIESSIDGTLTAGGEDCHAIGVPFTDPNSNNEYDCYPFYGDSIVIGICNDLEPVDQTVTVKVEDNDGNKASAEYDVVYDDLECDGSFLEQGESAPIATFLVEENSDGTYHVEVLQVTEEYNLTEFSFFLKDETGSTYVGGNGFGKIAMQMIAGTAHGIDVSYSDSCDDNCDSRLENRATNVSNDDGSEYPVHFFLDYGLDGPNGKLSAGDKFIVYGTGNSANGPASDNWRLDIQYDPSGDIIGSAKLM